MSDVVLTDACRRVLIDLRQAADETEDEKRRGSYRLSSSFEDYRRSIHMLRDLGYVECGNDSITPAGRAALSGGEP